MAGYGYMNQGYTDNWNRRSNGEYGYPDEEGRRGPIISYHPNNSSESYYVADYGYRSPTIVEPVKDYYGVKPSGPICVGIFQNSAVIYICLIYTLEHMGIINYRWYHHFDFSWDS